MAIYFNKPKDGSEYASFSVPDWSTVNSTIEFTELRWCSDEEYYYCYCFATKLTDFVFFDDKNYKFEPQKLAFKIARKTVKSWNSKTKTSEDRAQSEVEQLICRAFEELEEGKAYKGFLSLAASPFLSTALKGVDSQGKEIPDALREQILSTLYCFAETAIEHIKDEDLKIDSKKKGGYGSKSETEEERLKGRLSFLSGQLAAAGLSYKLESILDLHPATIEEKATQEELEKVIRFFDSFYLLLGK